MHGQLVVLLPVEKSKRSSADVRLWAFVSLLSASCIPTPASFRSLKMQTEPPAFGVSQLCCLCLSVSGAVGDASLYLLQQQPGGTYTWKEKAGGKEGRGNDLTDDSGVS